MSSIRIIITVKVENVEEMKKVLTEIREIPNLNAEVNIEIG